jgi:hypothetical protein
MELKVLLKQLGDDTGLGELTLDEAETCTILVDEMKVSMIHIIEGNRLLLFAEVGELAEEMCPALALAALKANYLFRGTGGATLSVNPETSMLCLNQSFLLEPIEYEVFIEIINGFVDTLAQWKSLLADYRPAPTASDEKEAIPSNFLRI